eukprot:12684312-Heterocapsa_arctica.AAC.1
METTQKRCSETIKKRCLETMTNKTLLGNGVRKCCSEAMKKRNGSVTETWKDVHQPNMVLGNGVRKRCSETIKQTYIGNNQQSYQDVRDGNKTETL